METESETVFDVLTAFHSACEIQKFMEIFSIENGFKIHKYQLQPMFLMGSDVSHFSIVEGYSERRHF